MYGIQPFLGGQSPCLQNDANYRPDFPLRSLPSTMQDKATIGEHVVGGVDAETPCILYQQRKTLR